MVADSAFVPFGPRFEAALLYAARVHALQWRKGTTTPYITHLLAVAALVGEEGGDEDEVIAALLHDAVEDQGGAGRLADIRARFGDAVAAIVAGCTAEAFPTWRATKEAYVARLAVASPAVLRVSSADKLHNARDPGRSPPSGRRPLGDLRRRQGGDALVLSGARRRVSTADRWPVGR